MLSYEFFVRRIHRLSLFNNSEEVKVPVHCEPRAEARVFNLNRELGLIVSCIQRTKGLNAANTSSPVAEDFGLEARGLKVIGSSEQVHVVDALAITGDEGRGSLR
jgi:hypothetical protein